jgi:hypothetical protein
MTPASPTHPAAIAGRYRVVREVGRGGMGSVWLCRDERLNRDVAVKQIGRLPGESATDLARAMREARSTAALNHRNVVSVFDAVEEGDHFWLVMEYVEGRTLGQIIAAEGPLPASRVAALGVQVAEGLAASHARGTVHRDVKPGNVLVTDDDLAKLSDFGIARTAGDPTLTQTGLVTGTPAYLAPEVARGEEPSPASDVWALGATLYAAVEGRPPYGDQGNALALLSRIASEPPPEPTRAGPLHGPIMRMLDVDPASRWSMADAAHALRRLVEHRPAVAAAATTALAAPTDAAADTAEEAPAPAPVPADVPPGPSTEAPASTPPGRRRRGGLLWVVALLVLLLLGLIGFALLTSGEPDGESQQSDDRATQATDEPSPDEPSGGPTSPEEPEETAEEPSEPASPTAAPPGGGRVGFVEDYYALLPEDTEAGYALLSSSYQDRTSFEEYDGFWSSIEDVTVTGSSPAGPDAVDAEITYDTGDGSESEVRRIYVERTDDGYVIVDDEIVG